MKKIKKIICLAGIAVLSLHLSACQTQKVEAKESEAVANTQSETEEEHMDPVLAWEKAAAALDQGNCCEITENPYIKGIDFDFSGEDIQQLKKILESKTFEYSEMNYEPEKAKYIINFYDKDEKNLLSFTQMDDGRLYMDEGYQVSCKELEELFNRRIKEESQD